MGVEDLVERYQCPGCARAEVAKGTACPSYRLVRGGGWARCAGHELLLASAGTYATASYTLPPAFRVSGFDSDGTPRKRLLVRLWLPGACPAWRSDQVPVLAQLEEDVVLGVRVLFVRTYFPMVGSDCVDVVPGASWGTVMDWPVQTVTDGSPVVREAVAAQAAEYRAMLGEG